MVGLEVTGRDGRGQTSPSILGVGENVKTARIKPLAKRVFEENRKYQSLRTTRLLKRYRLSEKNGRQECAAELTAQSGGLGYDQMVKIAERAGFREALATIGREVARLFRDVVQRTPELARRYG